MKAILNARVSDKKQDSNEAQMMRILDYCKSKGLTVWKKYEIEESSTQGDRKKFQEVIRDIQQSKEPIALVVDTVDRLQRSFKESVILDELRKLGKLEIHFYRESLILNQKSNSADILRWDMGVMFAKSYVLQLSDNVKRKQEAMVRNGERPGKPILGYQSVYDSEGKRTNIIPDPLRNHFMIKMFEMYATGNSVERIAKELQKMGLRSNTKNPKPIRASLIYNCLKNPFYYGMMDWKGNLYPHKYQPLISKQLFDKCQEIMTGYHKKPFQYAAIPFALRGMITCFDPACGCTVSPELKKGKYKLYACTNYKKVHEKKIYVSEEDLLNPIKEVITKLQMPESKIQQTVDKLKKINEAKNEFYYDNVASLRKEHDQIEKRTSNLFDLLTDGSITKEMFNKKLKEYKERQSEIEAQLAQYTHADKNFYLNASMLLHLVKRAVSVFDGSEPATQRQILNFLLQNCKLDGKKLSFELKTPFNRVFESATSDTKLRW